MRRHEQAMWAIRHLQTPDDVPARWLLLDYVLTGELPDLEAAPW